MSRLTSWWSQPDQFDWVTTFLRQRNLIRPAQVILAIISMSGSWVPLALLVSQRGSSALTAIVGVVTVAFTVAGVYYCCLLYTSPSPRDGLLSRMPSSA